MKDSTFKKYKLVVDEWFVNGFNGTKAYQKFYPDVDGDTAKASFSRMLTIDNVEKYAQSKRETIKKEHNITLEGQLEKLNRIRDKAENVEKFSDAVNAVKEENKLVALYKDHNDQKNPLLGVEKAKITFVRKRK